MKVRTIEDKDQESIQSSTTPNSGYQSFAEDKLQSI